MVDIPFLNQAPKQEQNQINQQSQADMKLDKPGLFSNMNSPKKDPVKDMNELYNQLNNLSRRVRLVEERQTNGRNKVQMIENNMVENDRKLLSDIKSEAEEIRQLKHEINDIKNNIKIIIKELQLGAKKEDVKVLEKYINIWEPVNFVTQAQVSNMVKDQVDAAMQDMNLKLQQEEYLNKLVNERLSTLNREKPLSGQQSQPPKIKK